MAYFLKQSKIKGRNYLAIYESFYNPEKKETAHKTFKSLGSVETLIKNGLEDPITYYQKEVDKLNAERNQKTVKKISDKSPIQYLGYFLLKAMMEKLEIEKNITPFKITNNFKYDLFSLLSTLVYARAVEPCSKRRAYNEIIPSLFEKYNFSYDQLMDGVSFLGENYEKFVEIFTTMTSKKFKLDTSKTYFDCTNFYFGIDREDLFRKKGPSKENRKDPIMGLGLLLDKNQIPIGMKMYPGNESEKPVLRDVIDKLKSKNNITGKTVHVADKGLNCAENIHASLLRKDGYVFSKSVKQLPAQEIKWVLLDNGYNEVKNKKGKLLYKYKCCTDVFPYSYIKDDKKIEFHLKEKRVVTYNPELAAKHRHEINKLIEKAKYLSVSKAKKKEFGESAKYVIFADKNGEKVFAKLNEKLINKHLMLAGYNLLVTSELEMSESEIYQTYHNLWRIEESFKIMKSQLDARPVYLQKEDTITGHFLICYLCVLLLRLLQFKKLDNKYCSEDIFSFIKNFRVVEVSENKYINITRATDFIKDFAKDTSLPLMSYYLSKGQISEMLSYRF